MAWVLEPRPAAIPKGETAPKLPVPGVLPAPARKDEPVMAATTWAGSKAPVDVSVFQKLALGSRSDPRSVVDELAEVDVTGDAICCSVVGTAEVNCDNVACVLVLADEPVAWVVAAACAANPPGAVVWGAAVNDGTLVAAADCAA
jgi:hypothetical protein